MKSKSFVLLSLILLSGISVLAAQDIKVISSSTRSLTLEFTPQYTDTSTVVINSQTFKRILFSGGEVLNPQDFGMPAIPFEAFSIGVPAEFGNTLQVTGSEYTEIQGRVAPVKKASFEDGMLEYSDVISEKYSTYKMNDLVSFGNYGLARSIPVQTVNVYPVQFDAEKNVIRLYKKIIIRINFASVKLNQATAAKEDDLLNGSLINYQAAKNFSVIEPKKLNKTSMNSVLSQGRWFRFEAPAEGIYKITAGFLKDQGLDPNSIDPKTIKIYNNGGKVLPEALSLTAPDDPVENAVFLSKTQDDGKFNSDDYILFYGRGNQFFDYDTVSHRVVRYFHPYSNSNYYWLTFSQGPSKKMQEVPSLSQNPDFIQTTTKAFASWEEDHYKIMNSGRLYMGEFFSEKDNIRTFLTSLNGIISGSTINYKVNFANRSEYSALVNVEENSTPILSKYISGVGKDNLNDPQGNHAINQTFTASSNLTLSDDRSVLKLTYKPSPGSESTGYLNYFEIYYDKLLKAYNDALLFYSLDSTGVEEFRLSGFGSSGIKVFDITDFANLKLLNTNISGGDCSFKAVVRTGNISKYIAVTPAAYILPGKFTEMGNSNVHATPEAKFIIITKKDFMDEALRLKAFKETKEKFRISTSVVDIDQIFNEFSNGMTDVSAIRNFIRYAYDNWSVKPEYVLLLGDGNYDYKDAEKAGGNFIIPYESYESFYYLGSYASDDFYVTVAGNDAILDLAIGRVNVKSRDEARYAVDKIIKYETDSSLGLWRNLVTMVADDHFDSDGPDKIDHGPQSEAVSNFYIPPTFDQNKIYEEFYPTVATGTGKRKPAVNQAIIRAINDGTLILNWIGHGNPEVWSHEYIFEKGVTIPQLVNDKYFFLVAATCDFGRYDETETQSSTELMLLKPDGGSIGAFTASRTVIASANFDLIQKFYSNLFRTDSTGYIQPIGKSYFATKMVRNQVNDLKYHLFGDPTIRLLAPMKTAGIDLINHMKLTGDVQIKALSKTSIDGSVRMTNGSIDSTFSGKGLISVYDSKKQVKMKEFGGAIATFQGGLLFRGMVSVENGKFSSSFQVPKDISYENKNGKVVAYLYNGSNENVVGYTNNIIVGGTDSSAVNDGKGPEITITFDNEKNTSSYLVSPTFMMDVKLKDDSGLNTTGTGIGHKITGILNDNEANPIDLSGYFVGDLNAGGKSGMIKYQFNGLESGDYKVQVRAWDIFNNSSEASEHFTVTGGTDLVVRDVLNYPNPFSTSTTFTFQRNTSNPVDVKIKVYTVAGRMIREIEGMSITDKFVRIDWDGRDNDGNLLANGVYLYKVIIKNADGEAKQEVLGKLAVIR